METLPFCEPYKIKMVEPLVRSTRQAREEWLKLTHHNLFNLRSEQVFIDLLTDSGTGAMSHLQWSAMLQGDESYAGSSSYYRLKEVVDELFDFPYFFPVHQGRAAENVLFSAMLSEGDVVPGNAHFATTAGHISKQKATSIDCTVDEGLKFESNQVLFKGNIDCEKLQKVFNQYPANKIPLVLLTITCNNAGGQPVSMENIKEVFRLCQSYGVPLFFDAARFAENAYFIKLYEKDYQHQSIKTIVQEMFSMVDGFMMSAKKNAIVNIGGLVGLRSQALFEAASVNVILCEGYINYGGLAGRDLEAIARGLLEGVDLNYLEARIKQVAYLGEQCVKRGVPIIQPVGGHGVFINVNDFYPHVPREEYPAQLLNVELYLEGGIRSSAKSALSFDRDPDTGKESYPSHELLWFSIPWRTYSNQHMDYVAAALANVYENRHRLRSGLRITQERKKLRYFSVELDRILR